MVTAGLSNAGAGVKTAVEALSKAVADAGVEVRVFGLEDQAWRDGEDATWRGAPAVALKTAGPAALGYAPAMRRALLDWRPDVVHSHGLWMHPARSALQWSKITRKPVVVSPHGMLAPAALKFSRMKKRIAELLYQRDALMFARCAFATSDAEAADVRLYGFGAPIAIIPNGIDAMGLRKSDSLKRKSIVYLGRIHPIKGLDCLVKAWARVECERMDWALRIVGPDEVGHADELRSLIRTLGAQRVSIEPPVYGRAKIDLLQEAALFVLPSHNENFGLVVGESLACGTPVISTKGAPWSGLLTHDCGWWIDHGEASLVEALRAAMSTPMGRLTQMGRRGRDWVERDFSWAALGRQASTVYAWAGAGGAQPPFVH
jgi:glycosyltransferase involved in cell wall biosynthesis